MIINCHEQKNVINNDRFEIVAPKRNKKRSVVYGKKHDAHTVKGVPKFANLHVSRVNPENTAEDIENLLKENFPEVRAEIFRPKHPSAYSSFKVSVYHANLKKAMDPNIWPYGSCISRFLYRQNRIQKELVTDQTQSTAVN